MTYIPLLEESATTIDDVMQKYPHIKEDCGYGYKRTFENKMRFDLIDYRQKNKVMVRIGRGSRLVREYPVLCTMFDKVSKVVAKYQVHTTETLYEKNITGVIALLAQAPKGVKAL